MTFALSSLQLGLVLLALLCIATGTFSQSVRLDRRGGSTNASGKKLMAWFCLERCGDSDKEIQAQVQQVKDNLDFFTGLSYEKYNLGDDSSLVLNNLTEIAPVLNEIQKPSGERLELYPMISSYPYPKDFINWMRKLWRNPQPFFAQIEEEINKYPYITGFNVDFEPAVGIVDQDALDYAAFLDVFGSFLHSKNKLLTVDIAHWTNLWNWTVLAQTTKPDKFMNMATYTGNLTAFTIRLTDSVDKFGVQRLGVGLETENPNTGKPFTDEELEPRFALLKDLKVQEIDIWRMPIVDNFWKFIKEWFHQQ